MTIRQRFSLVLFGDQEDGTWWRIGVVVFLALCWAWPMSKVIEAVAYRQAPIRYIEAYALDPNVTPGGQVEIRFDVDRARICPVISVSRAVADQSGREHVVLGYTRLSGTRPGREVYDSTIVVPSTVPPGPAVYFLRINYGCSFLNYWGWPIVVESPRVPLTVWPRKDKVPIGAEPVAFFDG